MFLSAVIKFHVEDSAKGLITCGLAFDEPNPSIIDEVIFADPGFEYRRLVEVGVLTSVSESVRSIHVSVVRSMVQAGASTSITSSIVE